LAIKALKDHGFDVEIVQILVSRNKNVGSVTMMLAENPIHIITGVKND
jgi:precorrin-6B methylase 2